MTTDTTIETTPALRSKINGKSMIVLAIVTALSFFGVDVGPELEATILTGLIYTSEIVTIVLRTFFSGTEIEGWFKKISA